MINQTASYFENMAGKLGLTIRIPRPNRAARAVCSAANGLIGLTILGTGAVLKKLSFIVLGALGIVGAALLSFDK